MIPLKTIIRKMTIAALSISTFRENWIPLMFVLGFAVTGYTAEKSLFYFYSLGIFIVYLGAILAFLLIRSRRKKKSK